MKSVSKKNKYIIDCQGDTYKIGEITGKIPKNHDCIIKGWEVENGKIIKKGQIIFVPGTGKFVLK